MKPTLNPCEINSENIILTLRRVWPEVSEMKGPDGSFVSWDNAAFGLSKKRVKLLLLLSNIKLSSESWLTLLAHKD